MKKSNLIILVVIIAIFLFFLAFQISMHNYAPKEAVKTERQANHK